MAASKKDFLPSDSSGASTKLGLSTAHLNATAYRIFKLLLWLYEKPLTLDELNERFYHDPEIQRRLSPDSIWLYINTLKALGCEITRPTRSNGFRYELLHHPFGVYLVKDTLNMLAQLKILAEEQLSFMEILALDRFFKKVLRRSSLGDEDNLIQGLFHASRSLDYEKWMPQIHRLQGLIQLNQLLEITYQSPVEGKERFYFLPEEFVYQNGLLYLRGNQSDRQEPSLLRLERIVNFEPVEMADMTQHLMQLKQKASQVVLHLLVSSPEEFKPFHLGETVRYLPELERLEVVIQTKDFFQLRQKLLENGVPFTILSPESFKADMKNILEQMSRMYIGDVLHA